MVYILHECIRATRPKKENRLIDNCISSIILFSSIRALSSIRAPPLYTSILRRKTDDEVLTSNIVELRNVGFSYQGKDGDSPMLFQGAEFNVDAKSRLVLLGENGNGKVITRTHACQVQIQSCK